MLLGPFLKEKRKQAGLTQYGLAHKAGVGIRFIRDIEQGKESFRLDKLNQVLRLFGHEMGPVPINRDSHLSYLDSKLENEPGDQII